MGIEKKSNQEHAEDLHAVNDNVKEVGSTPEPSEVPGIVESLKNRLSDRAWQHFERLYSAETKEEFEEIVRDLNALTKKDQLNYANPEVKIEEEIMADRMLDVQIPINSNGTSRILRVQCFLNGTYEFSAV